MLEQTCSGLNGICTGRYHFRQETGRLDMESMASLVESKRDVISEKADFWMDR